MKRTLLAVGFAILVSLLLFPYGHICDSRYPWDPPSPYQHTFFGCMDDVRGWWPFFLGAPLGNRDQLPRMFVYQTIFLAVLFAIVVNIRWWPRKKNRA